MKTTMKTIWSRMALAAVAAGLGAGASNLCAQTISASATLQETGFSGGEYSYTLTLDNTGTVPIDSFWYGWIPGAFDLPGAPTGIAALSGWAGADSGNSIQFRDNSVSSTSATPGVNAIAPGNTGVFTFQSTFDPTQMTTGNNGGAPTGDSIVYNAPGPMASFGGTSPGVGSAFFQPTSVPEPSTWALLAMGGVGFLARARASRKARVAPIRVSRS